MELEEIKITDQLLKSFATARVFKDHVIYYSYIFQSKKK